MRTIDADAHVIETPRTFDFLEESERKYAPILVLGSGGERETKRVPDHWLIERRVLIRENVMRNIDEAAREMADVDGRLRHMDELEIDIQVLYPTMFLRPVTQRASAYAALARSYNRWLAQIWERGKGRLRWVAMPPLTTMDKVRDELSWCKDHGACGVFLNALECDRLLTDPYFHPLYKAAEELDMALCIHAGNNSPTAHDFFIDAGFMVFKLAVINAFHGLIGENVPGMFPKARWGFIEVSAQWLPYVFNDLELRFRKRGKRLPDNPLKAYNMYVACQVTDDLPAVLAVAGEDNLVIGTDYGHSDTSTEIEALRLVRGKPGVPPGVVDKILGDNPKALYGLS
jgi:aminocarboxymuconate-semialdehyde decarboxylase